MSSVGGSIASRVAVALLSVAISSALLWYIGSGAFTEQLKGGVGEVVERGRTRALATQIQAQRGISRDRALRLARQRLAADEKARDGEPAGPSVEEAAEERTSLLGTIGGWLGAIAGRLWMAVRVPILA